MQQIDKDKKCYNCLGCNRLEDENFKGVYRCENAVIVERKENKENDRTR